MDIGILIYSITRLLTPVGYLVMIALVIDCFRNQKVSNKWGWIFFMFFMQPVGAIVYICVKRADVLAKIFAFLKTLIVSKPRTSSSQPISPPLYQSYEQGYQAYQQPVSPISSVPYASTPTPHYAEVDYPQNEQPQATYPEMPPQQQW